MIKFNHSAHIRLWDWLSKNPDKGKSLWPKWKENGGNVTPVQSYCFACDYDDKKSDESNDNGKNGWCPYCPLVWPYDKDCDNEKGLFRRWCNAPDNDDEKHFLAEQIRDLPVKEGVECK